MPSNWNKGQTKYTNPSVKKISDTMKLRKINNFKIWMDKMKAEGKIKSKYPPFKKDGNLAELIGVVLGDGHISSYPRTEELRIISNSIHLPTYTYKVQFSNRNVSMLRNVFRLVSLLGFHPHKSRDMIQLSKKNEVLEFINLIKFRKY